MSCGKYQEAEALIQKGLAGNPPAFIEKELKALKEALPHLADEKVSYVEVVGVLTPIPAGEQSAFLDTSGLPAGLYYCVLKGVDTTQKAERLVIIR